MKIVINFRENDIIYDVHNNTTISELKRMIYQQLLVLTSMQYLICDSTEMKDGFIVSDYNVHENTAITLTIRKYKPSATSTTSYSTPSTPSSTIKSVFSTAEKKKQYNTFVRQELSPKSLMRVRFVDGIAATKNDNDNDGGINRVHTVNTVRTVAPTTDFINGSSDKNNADHSNSKNINNNLN